MKIISLLMSFCPHCFIIHSEQLFLVYDTIVICYWNDFNATKRIKISSEEWATGKPDHLSNRSPVSCLCLIIPNEAKNLVTEGVIHSPSEQSVWAWWAKPKGCAFISTCQVKLFVRLQCQVHIKDAVVTRTSSLGDLRCLDPSPSQSSILAAT